MNQKFMKKLWKHDICCHFYTNIFVLNVISNIIFQILNVKIWKVKKLSHEFSFYISDFYLLFFTSEKKNFSLSKHFQITQKNKNFCFSWINSRLRLRPVEWELVAGKFIFLSIFFFQLVRLSSFSLILRNWNVRKCAFSLTFSSFLHQTDAKNYFQVIMMKKIYI